MKHPRAIVAVALTLLACSATTPKTNQYGDGSSKPLDVRSTRAKARNNPTATNQPHAVPGHGGTPRYPGAGSAPATFNDRGPVGTAAAAYLRAAPARTFMLEIDYVSGRRPDDGATSHIRSILSRELDKPGGIEVRVDDEIDDRRSEWSFSDIAALERRYRDAHSRDGIATMWIVYLSGQLKGESGTLGVAYEATGAVLFPDRIRSAATALVQADAIERAALTHEAGHLLGLVNIAIKSAYDHEDSDHPGHSKYDTSVMYWVIEDTSIGALLTGGPPDDFDRYDRADLEAIREG